MTTEPSSSLTSAALITKTWAERRAFPFTFTATTGSTNDDAKASGPREHLYLTAHQTAGRGRGRNQWLDVGAGEILLSTWSALAPAALNSITAPRVGLALHRAVARAWPHLPWALKAPNDLYVECFKLAGLLIEVISAGDSHQILVGLGLNALSHPGGLDTATSLARALGRAPTESEWFTFLDAWVTEFRRAVHDATSAELGPGVRRDLRRALNANAARPFEVADVSPAGDLIHAGGVVRWTDL